jgi:putative addiction module killer protein
LPNGIENSVIVGRSVQEIRINYDPGYRLYYVRRGKTIIILLCGGDKSSQSKDIEKAKQMADRL